MTFSNDSSLQTSVLPTSTPLAERVLQPFQRFAEQEASGGIVLLVCTLLALVWANSPWEDAYHHLWDQELVLGLGAFVARGTLHHVVNDGLMAVFFFVVGLEIKRETLVGELTSFQQAALPVAAALGGMLVPAAIFAAWNIGGPGARGWGIPMATDIAFALGVLALLGSRVPASLTTFLTALAIADDIGAVLIIAIFYTGGIAWPALAVAAGLVLLSFALGRAGVRRLGVFAVIGLLLWWAMLASGIHATVAGVLLAATIPANTRINERELLLHGRATLDDLGRTFDDAGPRSTLARVVLSSSRSQEGLHTLETLCEQAQPPLHRLEQALHGTVAFVIMPVFALANAGVSLEPHNVLAALRHPVALGILCGLVIGKLAGITIFTSLATRFGFATRPADLTRSHLMGGAALGGIGFTMALFIAELAFQNAPTLLAAAKVGVLAASVMASVVGWGMLRRGR